MKTRDGGRCLCCGETSARRLQVDHIAPWYFGGSHSLENLQTLCKVCNREKGTTNTNFRIHRDHSHAVCPSQFPQILSPTQDKAGDPDCWAQSIQRSINFFYGAAAVEKIVIGRKGRPFYEWTIHLFDENPPSWLASHLPQVLDAIRSARSNAGFEGPEGIRVIGPGGLETAHFKANEASGGASRFLGIPNGTECRLSLDGQIHVGVLRSGLLKVGHRSPFTSFSAAYQTIAGRSGNAWRAWELRFPGSSEWVRADTTRTHFEESNELEK